MTTRNTRESDLSGESMGAAYVRYLVCYDIVDNKKRKKFADFLKDLGLIPLQKSVFYGDLKPPEARLLAATADDMLDETEDSCLWFPCHLTIERIRSCTGLKNFEYDLPDGNKLL